MATSVGGIGVVDELLVGIDQAAVQREPRQRRQVPLEVQVGLDLGYADGRVALVDAARGAREFGIQQGRAAE